MTPATAPAAAAVVAYGTLFANAVMTIYTGTMPATPETALSGNNALVSFTFGDPPFGSPSIGGGFVGIVANFVSLSSTPVSTGVAGFGRASTASATVADFTVSTLAAGTGDVQFANTTVTSGIDVTLSSMTLEIAAT